MPIIKSDLKICKTCTTEKPREEFPLYVSGPKAGQLASASCKACKNRSVAEARKNASGSTEKYQPRQWYRLPDDIKQKCVSLYQDEKMSLTDVAKALGISVPSVQKALADLDVKARSYDEARDLFVEATYGSKEEREERQRKAERAREKRAKARRRERARAFLTSVLQGAKCHDCPETDWTVLQFDHREPVDKHRDISVLVGKGMSIETIKAEIQKCDIVCPTCHTRRTARMFGSWRLEV